MSLKGDFSKLAKIRERIAKAPEMAPIVAQRAAAATGGRAVFSAHGGAVEITVMASDRPPRRRRSFWSHGFVLAKGFMPPQWMQRIKRATDEAFRAVAGGV